tara:strand:+ start:91 stop:267 length:177 start_codon:yes stop_codon:yes gene_type:complete
MKRKLSPYSLYSSFPLNRADVGSIPPGENFYKTAIIKIKNNILNKCMYSSFVAYSSFS